MNKIFPRRTMHFVLAVVLVVTLGSAAPAIAQVPSPQPGEGEQSYVVRAGDTLSGIAFRFGTTTADLMQRNPQIWDPNLIFTGQTIVVPSTPVVAPPPGIPVTGPPPEDDPLHPETARQVLFDDFTTPGIWFTGIAPEWQIQYVGTQYRVLNNFLNSHVSSVRTVNQPNVHAAIDARQVGGPSSGFWGVVCRWQDINNFYAATISGDGTTGILRVQNGLHSWLNQGTADYDASAWNRVGITCDFNTITLFVNGDEVLQATDTVFTTGGMAGVMVGTRSAAGADVHFDNFTAYTRTTPIAMPPPGIPVTGPPDEPIHPDTARLVISDDFTFPRVFLTGAAPEWQIQYVGNEYRIVNHFFNSHVSSVRLVNHPNVHAAIDARQVGGPSSGFWGVVCRWQDINNFYAATVSGNGTTGILRVQNGLHNWLNQGTANYNPEAWNRVSATCDGNTIILFVNGEEALQATDTVFTTSGRAGVMVGTRGAPGTDVHFDNFTAYVR